MTDKIVIWNRLAALLPEPEAQHVRDAWDIGEQEAGLSMLIAGLLDHRVRLSETDRAQISVVSEIWGERENLAGRLLQCGGDGRPAAVELLDPDDVVLDAAELGAEGDLAQLLLVPWIECTRCGRTLMRGHTLEHWGDLSYLASHYLIVSPDDESIEREFSDESKQAAFDALLDDCPHRADA
ncbi:hypothetical protein AB0F11_37855 [Streptomyces sp. NPDC032472]|uniref:hypothetical protein n=1 Tax=Streptomyces sp. NPDC032472 TaxID=3155018 RepID=UPI0033D28C8D